VLVNAWHPLTRHTGCVAGAAGPSAVTKWNELRLNAS